MMHIHTRLASLASLAIAAFVAGATPAIAQDAPDLSQMDPAQMEKMLEQLTKLLTEADANKDGKTTREELSTHRAEMFAKLDRNGDGVANASDAPKRRFLGKKYQEKLNEVLPQFDTNQDGTITRAEWNTMKRDPFELLDANGDGAIDKSEIPTPEMIQGAGA